MLIDGEKWACEACVRGHRVSSCRHHDRPLIRINKKGRPFSVCRLCRGPCKAREEHSKLNSRDKKSDGESDAKSSGKVFMNGNEVTPFDGENGCCSLTRGLENSCSASCPAHFLCTHCTTTCTSPVFN
ncbi:hypothetical protein VTN96DRAFT_768 [Rasamsonia emersonii]